MTDNQDFERFKPGYEEPEDKSKGNTQNNDNSYPVNQNYINDQNRQSNIPPMNDPLQNTINQIGNTNNPNYGYQLQKVPNADTVLVLGILAIVFSFCYGFIGLILGIIGLVMANNANKVYLSNPSLYTEASHSNLKAGKVCSIIGLVIACLILLFVILAFVFAFSMAGWAASNAF
jgi:hypothetical protein